MELIYTDAQWHDLAVVAGCELDCEFGPGSRNSWQLECPADDAPAMSDGSLLYCDGGEVGGVVDGIAPDTGEGTVTFSGRTWHGVLDGNLIAPAAGQDYKTVDGEANAAIGSLIGEMGISDLFAADPADSGVRVSHQFGRPAATGYQGLVDMLAGSGAKLRTRFDSASRKCVLSAAPKGDYSTEELDGDRISVKIERDWRPVNHLACFGSGELKDRIRLDLYADESGNVSKTQSIFGAKHRGAVYDYSSADAEALEKDGKKKLEELQAADEIQVTLPDDSEYEIGDVVGGREPVTGIYTTATLTRKTVLIDGDGEMDVRYEAGGTASGVSLSNTSGGGNGGRAYLAGKGLTLEGYTFSAEVDAAALKAVEGKADAAAASASNASAAAGKAEATAKAATVATAENAKAIAGKQDALTAGANVSIDGATISAKDTTYGEATATEGGLMSAADKGRLDGLATGETVPKRAETAGKLAAARTVAISGAVNGSATWDGSGDLSIVVAGDAAAAGFLAAHPVGTYMETSGYDPSDYGGEWQAVPSVGPYTWLRTKSGRQECPRQTTSRRTAPTAVARARICSKALRRQGTGVRSSASISTAAGRPACCARGARTSTRSSPPSTTASSSSS